MKFFSSVVFLLSLSFTTSALAAADYLSYLSNNPPWNSYVPNNNDIFKKRGDGAFFWTNDAEPEQVPDSKLVTRDPVLVFKPNVTIEAERKTNYGVSIYKTKYTIDAFSRRLIENKKEDIENKRNLIFLGCSFTFGTGVADDENFPYYMSQYRPNFNVYNLGIYGAGANDILDDLRSFSRFKDISKTGGVVVYTAIFDHIERSICNTNCYGKTYRDWVLKKSNYQYDPENQVLVNRGSFQESRPITSMIYGLLSKIGLIDSINIPSKLSDEQIELYVMMISEMKKTAKDKFNADFYFTFYPGYYNEWERIKPFLKKYNIKYLDLSKMDLKESSGNRHAIILDGHPTKLAHYLYASILNYQLPK
ncbi:MAG: hypothetical protein ACXVAX_06465 [Pseudobdellovibrio sp.]